MSRRPQAEDRASEASLLLAATFLWHVGEFGRARKLCARVQEQSPMNAKALTLRGWIELTCKAKTKKEQEGRSRSVQFFDQANAQASGGKKDLEATMGKAAYFLTQRRYRDALEHLNQASDTPRLPPRLLARAPLNSRRSPRTHL